MSAFGYMQTSREQLANVRFTPESGHSETQVRFGLKKRTLVKFAAIRKTLIALCGILAA